MVPGEVRRYSTADRIRTVAGYFGGFEGTLLDVGARDRILERHLPTTVTYHSADTGAGHDVVLDLETDLRLEPRSYRAVVALDVIEHVEQIHQAFAALADVADEVLVVALPNIANQARRWHFLRHGDLGGKYRLLPTHQGDRHRWVTVYPELQIFVRAMADECGFDVIETCEEVVVTRRPIRWIAHLALRAFGSRGGALVERVTFFLRRRPALPTP